MRSSITLCLQRFFFLFVAGLAGCASVPGPRTFTLSEADLTRQITNQFPLERSLLGALNVKVEAPRVKLLPESNRIGTELNFTGSLPRPAKPT